MDSHRNPHTNTITLPQSRVIIANWMVRKIKTGKRKKVLNLTPYRTDKYRQVGGTLPRHFFNIFYN